jgi:NAD(P)-dependent dehydrogenase (short-subunit alcohol dehydrogenase family)
MAQLQFDDQVIIITGGGRGMGRSHSLLLASRGAKVVVNDVGCDLNGKGCDTAVAQNVVNEIETLGGIGLASADNIATPEGCMALVDKTMQKFGRVDAIVHNAGICYPTPLPEVTTTDLDANFNVHFRAALYLTEQAWPYFIRQGGGRLVYIVSAAGILGNNTYAHYGSAKMASVGLMRTVHLEGKEHGIRCNALAVGAFSRMSVGMLSPELGEWFKKYMNPEGVSAALAWLIHPDCPLSGEVINCLGWHVSRFFIGSTEGYTKIGLTPEDVRDNFGKIVSTNQWSIPESTMADLGNFAQAIVGVGGDVIPM